MAGRRNFGLRSPKKRRPAHNYNGPWFYGFWMIVLAIMVLAGIIVSAVCTLQ